MNRITRRAALAGTIPLLLLASCAPEPEQEVVDRILPPEEIEVTATADPIDNSAGTGGEEEPAQTLTDGQTQEAINQMNTGVLMWGNQSTEETPEDRAARLQPYIMEDSSAASDGNTPLIVNPEDGAEEVQTTSVMIRSTSPVTTTSNTVIVDYTLEVVPQFAVAMEDGSTSQMSQGSTYNYTLRVAGEWNGEAEQWMITGFTRL